MSNEDPATSVSGPGGTPPRKSPRQGIGGSPVGSTLSIVLAVVAVVAGFLILRNITDDDDGASSAIGDGTDVVDATTTTVDVGLDTTTAAADHDGPADRHRRCDRRRRQREWCARLGRAHDAPTLGTARLHDGRGDQRHLASSKSSIVYYDPAVAAAQAVAESVAPSMGGLEVAPVPTPVPIEGGALNGSGVVVMLGTAQADKTLEELAGGTAATTPETGTAPAVAGTETTTPTTDRHRLISPSTSARPDVSGSGSAGEEFGEQAPRGLLDAVLRFGERLVLAEAVGERFDPQSRVEHRPVERRVDRPDDRRGTDVRLGGERGDAADDLAGEARRVEPAFTGDHEVGAVEMVVEIEFVGDEFETGNESPAERSQRAAEAAGRAAALDRGDVVAELLAGTSGRGARAAG